jgi:hemolysin activation/secretion protein
MASHPDPTMTTGSMRHPLTLSVLTLLTGSALAAGPDAGQLLKDLQTLPRQACRGQQPADHRTGHAGPGRRGGPRVTVRQVRITGATVFPEAELQALLADGLKQPLSLAGLQAWRRASLQHYRQAGYLVARAYLPAQKVSGDTVEIAVVEGRLDRVVPHDTVGLGGDALRPLEACGRVSCCARSAWSPAGPA